MKIRRLADGRVMAGFAGGGRRRLRPARTVRGQAQGLSRATSPRAATELAKEWRTDRALRRLEAHDRPWSTPKNTLLVTGTGDVIQPTDGILGIGSGGNYALAAARALVAHTNSRAAEIVRAVLEIAAGIGIYTNANIVVEDSVLTDFAAPSTTTSTRPEIVDRTGPPHRRPGRRQAGRGHRHPQSLAAAAARPRRLRDEVAPKNILMIGPTGVGKTEIARRLATLTGAPFIKVEATKYTEVGYYGRDVESMVRDLVENAIGLVREQELERVEPEARRRVDERLLDLLAPPPSQLRRRRRLARHSPNATSAPARRCGPCSSAARWNTARVEITIEQKAHADDDHRHGPRQRQMDIDFQGMFEKILPKQRLAPRDDRRRGPPRALRAGMRGADRPGEGQRPGHRAGREPGHHLPRRDRQGRRPARAATAPTSRGRACSATCCRSSRARSSTPATATSAPTTSCSSPPAPSTAPSRAT